MAAKVKSNELTLTRIYDAPVAAVWEAWTDPDQVAQWWGPRGFTLTTHTKDLRSGGHWHYTMHSADGVDYANKTKYLEVVPQKKLVYDHGGNDEQKPLFRVTVLFIDLGDGRTKMDMTMTMPSVEAAQQTRGFIKKAGGDACWDRLAEHLEKTSTGKEQFFINRSFDAPRETVFRMWTDSEHVVKWLPPVGFTMEYLRTDIRPGGSTMYKMTNGADVTMYGRANYRRIEPPRLIEYTQEFCDAAGNLSRHPLAPSWPATMLTLVTFEEEAPDQTRVMVRWEPVGDFTAKELATFIAGRTGMTMGWTGSFDKLEEALRSE